MISKLYGYVDTNDNYTPYHFKNCSKNGCVTKHYLGYTIELTEDTGYCGGCAGNVPTTGGTFANDMPIPVSIRGDRYSSYPNNCCPGIVPPGDGVVFDDIYIDENGNTVTEWYFDIQDSPTPNCYELRDSHNEIIPLYTFTSDHNKQSLIRLGDKICVKPARFDCAAPSITWLSTFPGTSSPLKPILFPGYPKNIGILNSDLDLPDSDISLDFSEHIYPYNYQVNCDYTINIATETYTSELEISLVVPDFVYATHTIPPNSLGGTPSLCIKNPIFGSAGVSVGYNDGICNPSEVPCSKIGPNIIWDFKTGQVEEPLGCCSGDPQENYCCNKDFIKKIETQESYDCFKITSENRKFIGQRKNENGLEIDIHCNKNEITGQYYSFNPVIPVCVAQPIYMTVGQYDAVFQGVCDAEPIGSGSGEYCPKFFYDPDDFCIRLDLTYQPRTSTVSKSAVTLEFYYCEITYTECGQ